MGPAGSYGLLITPNTCCASVSSDICMSFWDRVPILLGCLYYRVCGRALLALGLHQYLRQYLLREFLSRVSLRVCVGWTFGSPRFNWIPENGGCFPGIFVARQCLGLAFVCDMGL